MKGWLETRVGSVMPRCSERQVEKLALFAGLILEENELLHLVSQRDSEYEVVKQIADSAAVADVISFCPGCRVLDVGSGAGLPGIVLKLLFGRIELHTLDSSPRKIAFQKKACSELGLDANFLLGDFRRMQTAAPMDVVIVKALGSHGDIIRKSRAWIGRSGLLIFMEGRVPNAAIESSVEKLGAFSHVTFTPYELGQLGSRRCLAIIYRK